MSTPKEHVFQHQGGVSVSSERPRTDIGPQGDHVTAYALFKEFILQLPKDQPKELISRAISMVDGHDYSNQVYWQKFQSAMSQEEQNVFLDRKERTSNKIAELTHYIRDEIPEQIKECTSLEDNKTIIQALKASNLSEKLVNQTQDAILKRNQSIWDAIATHLENRILMIRNQQKYASFPKEGNLRPPSGEGARVRQALAQLRVYSNAMASYSSSSSSSSTSTRPNAQEVARCIKHLFWYPPIPKRYLIDIKTPEGSKEWQEICQNRNYNIGTLPRNNELSILPFVTATHLDTVLSCFTNFNQAGFDIQLRKEFADLVIADWKLSPEQAATFQQNMNQFRDDYSSFRQRATQKPGLNLSPAASSSTISQPPPMVFSASAHALAHKSSPDQQAVPSTSAAATTSKESSSPKSTDNKPKKRRLSK